MTKAERNFDDDSYDEVEERLREQDPDEEDRAYFPVEESKPPHYQKRIEGMKYVITRQDREEDDITNQVFDNYDVAYDLLEEIYADLCSSDADYDDRPYYEISEVK